MIINSADKATRLELFGFLNKMGLQLIMSDDFQAIGRTDCEGRIIAVAGFNGFIGNTAHMHIAGIGNWLSREGLKQAFHYPFIQLKLECLFGMVASNNKRALRFNYRMGFKEFDRIHSGWQPKVDLVMFKMNRDECPWIRDIMQRKIKEAA